MFVLSSKAKTDLIKIAKYTQITWGVPQPILSSSHDKNC